MRRDVGCKYDEKIIHFTAFLPHQLAKPINLASINIVGFLRSYCANVSLIDPWLPLTPNIAYLSVSGRSPAAA
jgi:hypothetical protein